MKIEETSEEHAIKYIIKGQVFFASVQDFVKSFKTDEQTKKVILDFSEAHIWDDSAVAAIDKVVLKMKDQGIDVDLIGLNESSWKLSKNWQLMISLIVQCQITKKRVMKGV